MFRLLASALGVTCVLITSSADAQIVRVGPFGGVSIRAPFVSVDAIPGGGARVRAPFTSVNTGVFRYGYGYGYGPVYRPYRYGYYAPPVYYESVPVYPVPVYPEAVYPEAVYPEAVYPEAVYPEAGVAPPAARYQAARPPIMDAGEISKRLRASAQRLARSLSQRRNDSDVWLNYLAPDQIIEAIDRGQPPESLRQLLLNYDGVVGNASLGSIRRSGGFEETHRWLRHFVQIGANTPQPPPAVPSPASDGDSVLAPVADPAPAQDAVSGEPTPAKPIQSADDDSEDDSETEGDDLIEPIAKPEPRELPTPTPL